MKHTSSTLTALVVGSPNPNPNHRTKQRNHKDRDRYADAGRSAREAMSRFRAAEQQAREDGRKLPPSCARVMLALVEQLTTWSRRNDAVPISTPPRPKYPAGGLVESTGLTRNTVRKALALLEGYGCITVITPENVEGRKTGATVIAFPTVDHLPAEDRPEDMADEDTGAPAPDDGWTAPRYRASRSLQDDPYPVTPDSRGTRSLQTDPLTRSNYEKEVRGSAKCEASSSRSPVGRSSDRPPTSPVGDVRRTRPPASSYQGPSGVTFAEWWHSLDPAERDKHGAIARVMNVEAAA